MIRTVPKGITIIEMLISISLVSILMLAAISATNIIAKMEVKYITQKIYNSVIYAKSEAIKRNLSVSLCISEDGQSCSITKTDWKAGWIVFADTNGNANLDSGEDTLKKIINIKDDMKILLDQGMTLTFDSLGEVVANDFLVCFKDYVGKVSILTISKIKKELYKGVCPK